jgi:uncharacterized membrane protein YhiD involved in acid resistance
MSFSDVIKKSVLESFAASDMSAKYVAVILAETFLIALYIFLVYRYITRSSFYNKGYAVSMAMISVITAGIILAMQSNLVISLGMVGALSIVRFRTAIKEPMDLLFLFWSIGTGIITGAGLFSLGVLIAVMVTIGLIVLNFVPVLSAPELLVLKINGSAEAAVMSLVKEGTISFKVDSKSITKSAMTLVIEVRTKDGSSLVNRISEVEGVISATLMQHEGEVKN